MYYTIITTFRGFQVLRHMIVSKSCKVGYPADSAGTEVVQMWINKDGAQTIIAKPTASSFGCYDQWCLGSTMEIKTDSCHYDKYHIFSYVIKREKLLPQLKYAKIPSSYYGITPDSLFKMILKYPFVETLIKQKQFVILNYMDGNMSRVASLWPCIKIALMHGLNLVKAAAITYFDYLYMSKAIGRDMRSPKYLLPKYLKAAHQEALKLIKKLDDKIEKEEKLKTALAYEAKYTTEQAKIFALEFQ